MRSYPIKPYADNTVAQSLSGVLPMGRTRLLAPQTPFRGNTLRILPLHPRSF
jgi:hypothetical protein